jgi:phenylpropionate dioxygenase-like ring-hydroxylating dioxygenase large terminal subunit
LSDSELDLSALINSYRPNYSLPAQFYNDPAVYRHDLETVFSRAWIYAGHVSQLPDAGCYLLLDFGGESIIVVKGKDSEVRAFANVCRHRGSRICLHQSGKVRTFVCPYHAWTYDLDGTLRSKREMPGEFQRQDFGLKPVRAGVFHGLIFVNLDPDAPDLHAGLSEMNSALNIYNLKTAKVACQKTFTVEANWKLAIENFMECYHCAPAHAEYSCSHALNKPEDYEALRPAMLKRSEALGYQIESLDQSKPADRNAIQYFYTRSALYDPYVTGSQDGKPVAPLLGDIKEFGGGAADTMFGPATYGILYPDHAVLYRFLPADVQKTDMEIVWLVHEQAEAGKDYDLDRLTWLWTVTTESDKTIILNNQKGVNSRFYEPGPLSGMETFLTTFVEWYLEQINVEG